MRRESVVIKAEPNTADLYIYVNGPTFAWHAHELHNHFVIDNTYSDHAGYICHSRDRYDGAFFTNLHE